MDAYSYNCNILFTFSKWLNFKGLSDLTLIYNDPVPVDVKAESETTPLGHQ